MAAISQLSPLATATTIAFFFIFFFFSICILQVEGTNWCVARSDATNQALQTALDYACGAGADCTPILSNGLCYLPNTMQAHASYAFNSFFQRKGMAPGSCDFSGTATIARTDPSYGSCVYPSSVSTAGATPTTATTPTTNTNNPNSPATTTIPSTTTPLTNDGGNGLNPGMNPPITDNSKASSTYMGITILMSISFWLLLSFAFPHL
ncbi:hypothetical protein ACOSP7_006444 [Xanthoceras sorbifolium]|uniref:X8 domain-containing protein n=1 Tax=Xanthoceras sorbifolium TaxID=99658 RepID=A0ABQ8I8R8_9ROSI|nr:hypothetical protein JRO89_XS03G0054700 [Xanthoceras sorbifolium]